MNQGRFPSHLPLEKAYVDLDKRRYGISVVAPMLFKPRTQLCKQADVWRAWTCDPVNLERVDQRPVRRTTFDTDYLGNMKAFWGFLYSNEGNQVCTVTSKILRCHGAMFFIT